MPWGDATFNHEQIKVLKGELQDVAMNCPQTRMAELKALSAFLGTAVGPHVYVKFIGD